MMDRNAVERFSVNARVKLRRSVDSAMANLGIGEGREPESIDSSGDLVILNLPAGLRRALTSKEESWRQKLIDVVRSEGYDNVVERVAYTWFNRLIAIRYMEVNDYLPTHVRVLSSSDSTKREPDMVAQCVRLFDRLELSEEERRMILDLRDRNKSDILFSKMFLFECRSLNRILPELFTDTKPYEGLLLDLSYTVQDSVVRELVDMIPEENFRDTVQIIGWMYQFYNSELKDEVFADLKKNVKISKEHIPAATQLFTPDWIVRYMVENSVGRVWLEGHDDQSLRSKWRYYIEEAEQEPDVASALMGMHSSRKSMMPSDIRVIDPCMGSGHILVYAFDILMQIYESYGYLPSDAAEIILTENLFGLDIDDRAYQLAYFAVMMKARRYDPSIFTKNVRPNLHSIPESGIVSDESLSVYGQNMPADERSEAIHDLRYLIQLFKDAKMYGSLLKPKDIDYIRIGKAVDDLTKTLDYNPEVHRRVEDIITVAEMLSDTYDAVVTNPPYLRRSKLDNKLKDYLESHYSEYNPDLYSAFIQRSIFLQNNDGYVSMITQSSFTFKSSFGKMRQSLRKNASFLNFVRLGPGAFENIPGEVVQSVVFTLSTICPGRKMTYVDLFRVKGFNEKRKAFDDQRNRTIIEGEDGIDDTSPFFGNDHPKNVVNVDARIGSQPGSNLIYHWWEVHFNDPKYKPYNKGGKNQKWYGNQLWVLKYGCDGSDVIKNGGHLSNMDHYFKPMISWTRVSSSLNMRYYPEGFIFDNTSPAIFNDLNYLIGFYNSDICEKRRIEIYGGNKIELGHIKALAPITINNDDKRQVESLSEECIASSKKIWDSSELSWSFQGIQHSNDFLEKICKMVLERKKEIISTIHANETIINQIFSKYYDEINIDTRQQPTLNDNEQIISEVKKIISFFIGCIFGRYSLDKSGLQFAGGEFEPKEQRFMPDPDNIIPINDSEYYDDDIVTRFVEFIRIAFGEEQLEENLKFIAENLGIKCTGTSRDIIRKYFLNNFYKDHLKMYSNLPIYWLFDSGKENGFKALIYMHRYTPDLIPKMRQDYFLPMLTRYMEQSKTAEGASKAVLQKKIEELQTYDIALEKYASDKVSIDLDDGIKVNYAKFQNIENPGSRKKIDLLRPLK